jgi:hypothetical protein
MTTIPRWRKRLAQDLREIQIRLPCPLPVRLLWRPLGGGNVADSGQARGAIEIVIDPRLVRSYDFACYLLVHEYAHCREYREGPAAWVRHDHDAHWGIEHAKVYREFFGAR